MILPESRRRNPFDRRGAKSIVAVMIAAAMVASMTAPIMASLLPGDEGTAVAAAPDWVVGPDGLLVPHYFGPYPNWATSQLPTVNTTLEPTISAVVRGGDNLVYHANYQITGPMSGWTALPAMTTIDTPAAAFVSDVEYFVVRGMDGSSLWFSSKNMASGAFSGWTQLNGFTPSAPVLASSGTTLVLVVRGLDDQIWYRPFDTLTQTWGAFKALPSGLTQDKPAAVLIGTTLHVVVRGLEFNTTMYYSTVDINSGAFSGWTLLTGATASAPTMAVMDGAPGFYLVVRGTDFVIWLNKFNGVSWEGWLANPSGTTPATPAATVSGNELHVVVIGMDGASLWHTSMNVLTSMFLSWTPLTGSTSSPPTLTPGVAAITTDVSGGIRKFIDSLPGLGPANANNLGQYIPVAIPDTTTYNGSDYYEIALVEFEQQMHSDLPAPTKLRGYVQLETPVNFDVSNHVALTYLDGSPILKANGEQAIAVDIPRYLGPAIVAEKDKPVRINFTNLLPIGEAGDLFIPVDTTVMGSGEGPVPLPGMPLRPDGSPIMESYTQNRATLHLHGGRTPWISDGTPHQWITPAGENTSYPKGVSVYNVPDMPDPGPGSMTFFYTNQQSARLMFYHDHAYGITRLNVYIGEAAPYIVRDATEQALISSGLIPTDEIPLVIQDKTFVPDDTTPISNMWGNFSSQLAFQDPTWDTTRWGTPGDLWYPHVYMTMQNGNDGVGGMNPFGRWHYGPWFWPPTTNVLYGPVANPYYDPANPNDPFEPPLIPGVPHPSSPGEGFLDTPVVNGVAYPYLEVEPKAYRFRILNAANDRFWNLQLFVADPSVVTADGRINTEVKMVPAVPTPGFPENWPIDSRDGGVPDPATMGPPFIQIGNEGGFLPAPVVLYPQPVDWNTDQGTFDFGLVDTYSLVLAAAERADVIVDFSQFAGKTLILYNDYPAPDPAAEPRVDYYTGNLDQTDTGGAPSTVAGFGPNTRTIMQIIVGNVTPAAPFDSDALFAAFASNDTHVGVFAESQNDIIVPQPAYNSAYNANFPEKQGSIFSTNLTFTPIGAVDPVTINLNYKTIQDEMGEAYDLEFGRMAVLLGVELEKTAALQQTMMLYNFYDPPTEVIKNNDLLGTQIGSLDDGTQIWKIVHNGVDVHPVHWHMFEVQLLNRVAWDNNIRPTDPNELGWKETIRVKPLQNIFVALRPVVPDVPFDLPNSIRLIDPTKPEGTVLKSSTQFELTGQGAPVFDPHGEMIDIVNHKINFGWEYVWHCHILAHEEMDMMRAMIMAVSPRAPTGLSAEWATGMPGVNLTWTDDSLSETNFVIERAEAPGGPWTPVGVVAGANGTGSILTYTDAPVASGTPYYYRVIAVNLVGDTWNYSDPNINEEPVGFPTITMWSAPSNVVSIG